MEATRRGGHSAAGGGPEEGRPPYPAHQPADRAVAPDEEQPARHQRTHLGAGDLHRSPGAEHRLRSRQLAESRVGEEEREEAECTDPNRAARQRHQVDQRRVEVAPCDLDELLHGSVIADRVLGVEQDREAQVDVGAAARAGTAVGVSAAAGACTMAGPRLMFRMSCGRPTRPRPGRAWMGAARCSRPSPRRRPHPQEHQTRVPPFRAAQ